MLKRYFGDFLNQGAEDRAVIERQFDEGSFERAFIKLG
jgi:hypothetical protein